MFAGMNLLAFLHLLVFASVLPVSARATVSRPPGSVVSISQHDPQSTPRPVGFLGRQFGKVADSVVGFVAEKKDAARREAEREFFHLAFTEYFGKDFISSVPEIERDGLSGAEALAWGAGNGQPLAASSLNGMAEDHVQKAFEALDDYQAIRARPRPAERYRTTNKLDVKVMVCGYLKVGD